MLTFQASQRLDLIPNIEYHHQLTSTLSFLKHGLYELYNFVRRATRRLNKGFETLDLESHG